jgi:hypothetical protein
MTHKEIAAKQVQVESFGDDSTEDRYYLLICGVKVGNYSYDSANRKRDELRRALERLLDDPQNGPIPF